MSLFIEQIKQSSIYKPYKPGANLCINCNSSTPIAKCNDCDWNFEQIPCEIGCPSQPHCSRLDPNPGSNCPILGKNVIQEYAKSEYGFCLKSNNISLINCIYDSSTFTYNDILKYYDYFDKNSKNYNQIIMPNFCIHGLENLYILEDSEIGELCKNWANENISVVDEYIKDYCSKNITNKCDCINKVTDPLYRYILNGLATKHKSFLPEKWYKPCLNPQEYLIPYNLTISNKSTSNEIDNMCDTINDIIKTFPTNLTKKQLQEKINCDITITPSPTVQPTVTSNGTTDTSSSFWVWIVIIIIVIIIILMIIIFIFSY